MEHSRGSGVQHVVIVPADEYERMRARLDFCERVMGDPDDRGKSEAEAFLAHFDPSRYGEGWGHVAFCLARAWERRQQREADRA